MSARREAIALAFTLLLVGLIFLSPAYIRPDSVGVYAYLRSLVFDGDLLFLNEWSSFGLIRNGFTLFKEVTPLGTLANHWWIGTSIASAPFYLVAAAIAPAGDGFFGMFGWTLAWSAVLFTFVTLFIALKLIDGDAKTRWTALAGILFGTPLFWYTFRLPLGTHAAGAMFVALACYAALRDRHFLTGLLLGLAIATRLQHFVLLPAFAVLAMRRHYRWDAYARAAAGMVIALLPQAIAWYAIYGSPLGPLAGGANLGGTTWMPFRSSALGAVLFSSYHGLFIWSPVVVLAIIGWLLGLRTHRDAALLFLLMFAGEWIANGLFDRYFWGGLSFGPRRFVDLAAPFAVGLAWFVDRRWSRVIAVAVATLWSCVLTVEALSGTLPLERYVGVSDLLASLGPIQLHSGISDPRSFAALAIVLAVAALLFLARRIAAPLAAAYLLLISVVLLAITPGTRARASAEIARLRIDRRLAARAGPLLDQRKLLGDEVQYLRATGQEDRARATEREIAAIDQLLRELR
jgi:hypothetical protein